MDMAMIGWGVAGLACVSGLSATLWRQSVVQQLRESLARLPMLEEELGLARDQVAQLQSMADAARQTEAEARTELRILQARLEKSETEATHAKEAERAAETRALIAEQQRKEWAARMEDWERVKEETLRAASASVMKAGSDLSSKLLEDHKREAEALRKHQEEQAQQASEKLAKDFGTLTQTVATLHTQVGEQRSTVQGLFKALTTPSEAGYFTEVGLENCLKAFGLEVGRDYLLQFHTSGELGKLRPDAIVFLPQESLMVIDCKASIFLVDAEIEENADALPNLKRAMLAHLRGLSAKDYQSAVLASLKQQGRGTTIRRTFNIMFLPTENALERVLRADPEFLARCMQHDIIPAGPTGLAGLIALTRIEMDLARQAEHQEDIIEGVQALLESVAVMLGHAEGVGKSLKTAADKFAGFATSANRRVLPRARALEKLGVRPAKNKPLPNLLPSFHILDEDRMLEADDLPALAAPVD